MKKLKFRKRTKLTTVLGLVIDGGKLEGVVLRRSDGALHKLQSFSAPLTLDLLTAAPELAGREIRNQLDAAGVRERSCVVGLPLKWVLAAQTELPPLPEADAASLLQLEAEKGFHADAATLQIASSRCPLAGGKQLVLLGGVPQSHITALRQILEAAKLNPVNFGLGICALQPPTPRDAAHASQPAAPATPAQDGVMALAIGESNVGLLVTVGGGLAALRALDGAIETEGSHRSLNTEVISREARVTLGQLPAELRDRVKRIRIFGPRELAQQLAHEMERFQAMGLKVETVSAYAPDAFRATLPPDTSLSPAFSLAASVLTNQTPPLDFLPPTPTVIEQLTAKFASGQLRTTGAIAVGAAVILLGLFLYQEIQLLSLRSQWDQIKDKVADIQGVENNIRMFRSWEPGDYHSLAILRELSLAFPQTGSVTAKVISTREDGSVNCSGIAQDMSSLLEVQAQLSALPGVSAVHLESGRGNKPPIQFVFTFKYNGIPQ